MKLDIMPLGALGANCILLSDNDKRLTIIDPGSESSKIVQYITDGGYEPYQIFLTHGHFDHVCAAGALQDKYHVPVFIHPEEIALVDEAPVINAMHGTSKECKAPKIDNYLNDGEIFNFGEVEIKVIHTPGHTPGCVCFYIPQMSVLISGDTLFRESIGRTDLPGGNQEAIEESILTKLYTLPDYTKVYPGHGSNTTIKHEKHFNPFVRGE